MNTYNTLVSNFPDCDIKRTSDSITINDEIEVVLKFKKVYFRHYPNKSYVTDEELVKLISNNEGIYKDDKEEVVYKLSNRVSNDYLYFLVIDDKVKIGRAKSVHNRGLQLKTAIPDQFLMYYLKYKGVEEKDLQKHFQKYHLQGEWFKLSKSIIVFMDTYIKDSPIHSNALVKEEVEKTVSEKFIKNTCENHILKYGKYKGFSIAHVTKLDLHYAKWLIRPDTNMLSEKMKDHLKFHIETTV